MEGTNDMEERKEVRKACRNGSKQTCQTMHAIRSWWQLVTINRDKCIRQRGYTRYVAVLCLTYTSVLNYSIDSDGDGDASLRATNIAEWGE